MHKTFATAITLFTLSTTGFTATITPCETMDTSMSIYSVDPNGSTYNTIQSAIDAAEQSDSAAIITVASGTYQESVHVSGNNIHLCGQDTVTITNTDSTYGIRLSGTGLTLQNITATGITHETYGVDHGPSGVVISGQNITVKNVHSHHNMTNGFLLTDTAQNIRIENGSAYDNTLTGVALSGGDTITIDGISLYNTGSESSAEGNYQEYGILSDNVGDTRDDGAGNISDIEGISHISNLTVSNTDIRNHLKYGIRISAANESLSNLESGRITTRNFDLLNSTFSDNGIALDSFVGGLYHHGNILLQHIEGGLVEGNTITRGYTWGLDAYACNNITYRNNFFLDNNLGEDTQNVTISPSGIEINGGRGNIFTQNLIYGNSSGLFSSYIPDSGDGFDQAADQYDSYDGTFSLAISNNIILNNYGTFISYEESGPVDEVGVDFQMTGDETIFTRTFTNNIIGTAPEWMGGDPAVFSETFATDNPLYRLTSGDIFTDAANGNFTILPTSQAYGQNIGPDSINGSGNTSSSNSSSSSSSSSSTSSSSSSNSSASSSTDSATIGSVSSIRAFFTGHSGINIATPVYASLAASGNSQSLNQNTYAIGGGFIDWMFDPTPTSAENTLAIDESTNNLADRFILNPTESFGALIMTEQSALADARSSFTTDTSTTDCETLKSIDLTDENARQAYVASKVWQTGEPWATPGYIQLAYDVSQCYTYQNNPAPKFYFFMHWDDNFPGAELSFETMDDLGNIANLTEAGSYRTQLQSWITFWENTIDSVNRSEIRIVPVAKAFLWLIETMEDGTAPGFEGNLHASNGRLSWVNYLVHADATHLTNAGIYFNSLVAYATLHQTSPIGLPLPTDSEGESLINQVSYGYNDGTLVEGDSLSLDWGVNSTGNITITPELRQHMQQIAWEVAQEQILADMERRGELASFTLSLSSGWNLLSSPVESGINTSLFSNHQAIWSYVDKQWNLNPDTIAKEQGFWIKSTKGQEISLNGVSYKANLDALGASEWHLMGTGERLDSSDLEKMRTVWVYSEENGWKNPGSITSGQGFWVIK